MKQILSLIFMFVCIQARAEESNLWTDYSKADEIQSAVEWLLILKNTGITHVPIKKSFQKILKITKNNVEKPEEYPAYLPLGGINLGTVIFVDKGKLKFSLNAPYVSQEATKRMIEYNYKSSSVLDSFDALFVTVANVNNSIATIYGETPLMITKDNINPSMLINRGGYLALTLDVNPKATAIMLEDFLLQIWNTIQIGSAEMKLPEVMSNICGKYLEKHNN